LKNQKDLEILLEKVAEEIIEEVAEDVMENLRSQILDNVYTIASWYAPDDNMKPTGEPTWEFLNSWNWKPLKKTLKTMSKKLFYDYAGTGMSNNSRRWIHGSPIPGYADSRKNLEDILNNKFTGYNYGPTSSLVDGAGNYFSHERTPYWESFIRDMIDNGGLEILFDIAFYKRGFVKT